MLTNRHPADELAEVRAAIRRLKEREQELREYLLKPDSDPCGEQWIASIETHAHVRLDVAALKAHFGSAVLKPFMRPRTLTQVRLGRADWWSAQEDDE